MDRGGEWRESARDSPSLVASETSEVDGLVPVVAHVERTFASRVEQLPEETREALLIAAVDDLGLLDVIGRATSLAALEPRRGRWSRADPRGAARVSPSARPVRDLPGRVSDRTARSTRSAGHCAPSGRGFSAGLASRQLRRRGRRGSCGRDGGRGAWMRRPGGVQARRRPRGGARPSSRPVRTRGRGGCLAASEASWEAGAGDPARQAADAALATCADPLLARRHRPWLRPESASQSGGVAERDLADVAWRGHRRRFAGLNSCGVPAGRLRSPRFGRRGTPSRTWSSRAPRVRRRATATTRSSTTSSASSLHAKGRVVTNPRRLLEAVERAISERPGPAGTIHAPSCLAADCAWWRSNPRRRPVRYYTRRRLPARVSSASPPS